MPSVPTTVPAELTPKAMAAVDPLMFRSFATVDVSGLAVKFVKMAPSGVAKPVTVPVLEIPLLLVPVPAVVPATGPSKLVNL